MPRCGISGGRAGRSAREGRAAGCSSPLTAAPIGVKSSSATGLPAKPWGRVAVQVAPSKPQVVYANIEAEKGRGLYRSDDAGANWTKLDASNYMVWRPFYFGNLIVDPKDENKVFKPDLILLLSNDGGKTFNVVSGGAHGDFHDVWIDPKNPNIVIAGDDGGLWRSEDGGNRWKHEMNLPVSQFYHVSADNADPYHVYGGLQDNSSWVGDSSYPGGVSNSRWENMFGGDGFWMFEDTSDPDYIYAEAQGGEIGRVNRYTHETRDIHPWPNYGEKKLRFNWNTPIHMSPNEKGTIYIGAQFLFRSRDHGQSWDRISPDLTTNDPEKQKQEESGGVTIDNSSAEMHTTIYSISESPKNGQIIWVGTDDGNVQITRDGAKTWTNVVGNIGGLGKNSWVSTIEASRFDEGTAYATFDRHYVRRYEDRTFTRPRTTVKRGPRFRRRRAGCAAMRTWSRKTRSAATYFSWARNSGSGFQRTADNAGRNTRERTFRRWRCMTSWCSRGNPILCWRRTGAASGSWTIFRRCGRLRRKS